LTRTPLRLTGSFTLTLALALAACGSGQTAAPTASAPASASQVQVQAAAASASAGGQARGGEREGNGEREGAGEREGGEGGEGGVRTQRLAITASDSGLQPTTLSARAGVVEFDVTNKGQQPHDVAVTGNGTNGDSGMVAPGGTARFQGTWWPEVTRSSLIQTSSRLLRP
jgi:hypothetical protein